MTGSWRRPLVGDKAKVSILFVEDNRHSHVPQIRTFWELEAPKQIPFLCCLSTHFSIPFGYIISARRVRILELRMVQIHTKFTFLHILRYFVPWQDRT